MTEQILDEQLALEDVKAYELGYLLSPLVPEEAKNDTVDQIIKKILIDLGGEIIGELNPNMRHLAYPISKSFNHKRTVYKDAYFGAIQFKLLPSKIEDLKKALDKEDNVLRYLLLVLSKNSKVLGKDIPAPVVTDSQEVVESPEAIDSEQIDKEIEDLLV